MRRTTSRRVERPRRAAWALALAALALAGPPAAAQTAQEIASTRHNLSVTGPGPVRALTETRICIFCHTPHNATPSSPLWNRELEPQSYDTYTSPTLSAGAIPPPGGPTKLCLSCHDGTVALGAVVEPPGGITVAGGLTPDRTDFGRDLRDHHPVGFQYGAAAGDPQIVQPPPDDLLHGGTEVHCTTCHNPHRDDKGMFLVKDNRYSALCTSCHQLSGWTTSAHATSTASVAGILPLPPRRWPTWTQLGEWGCESCHTPHFAPTGPQLLLFSDTGPTPFGCTSAGCHGSAPGSPHGAQAAHGTGVGASVATVRGDASRGPSDIDAQLRKRSAHRSSRGSFAATWRTGGSGRSGIRAVACADCHEPHQVNDRRAEPPYASGLLAGASGVNADGVELRTATYEYEICFKCHADASGDVEAVPRVLSSTNTRTDFAAGNPSYHPVVATGGRAEVPSLGTALEPGLSRTDLMSCTTCHADDDGGSRGPHGSDWAPLLRQRYDLGDGSVESLEAYALCYRCHERTSILADASFRRTHPGVTASGGGHSGHLRAGASCAACHDPHGVPADEGGGTGSHTHLVNFDLRVVQPLPGAIAPVFRDEGSFAGSCALVCHGVVHQGSGYR